MDSSSFLRISAPVATTLAITADIRRVLILLAVDASGLKHALEDVPFLKSSSVDVTAARLLKAGTVLGVFRNCSDDQYTWGRDFEWVCNDASAWEQLMAIVHQQLTYISMVSDVSFWSNSAMTPSEQVKRDPSGYFDFLTGVAASHVGHAIWISELNVLEHCTAIADIGGGLGTYGLQWIKSRRDRSGTIVDFPEVGAFLKAALEQADDRLTFIGADVLKPFSLPASTDFALFANVLHLVESWKEVLLRTVSQLRHGSILGVDLQVHLRSGRRSGLISPGRINQALVSCQLTNVRQLRTRDSADPYQRDYNLWIGTV
jgi:hypothetical protein